MIVWQGVKGGGLESTKIDVYLRQNGEAMNAFPLYLWHSHSAEKPTFLLYLGLRFYRLRIILSPPHFLNETIRRTPRNGGWSPFLMALAILAEVNRLQANLIGC